MNNKKKIQEEDKMKRIQKELVIKILILIILILLIVITSFRSGEKFYLLKNAYFGDNDTNIGSSIARWNFEAKIIYKNEVNLFENN